MGTKIAISLPDEVFQAVEKERLARGESRSQFFRRAAQEYLRRQREQQLDEQYVRGYLKHPETEEEIALSESTLADALAESPWEDDSQA